MKILHITPSYYPAFKYGGPIESVHLLNKTLVEKGITVDVFTTDAGTDKNNSVEINKWKTIDGVRVKYFKYFFYEHYTFSPSLLIAALKEVSNYDLVHITGVWNFPVLAGALACILNKKPFIISTRGALHKDAINIKSKFIKLVYFNLAARYYLNKASAIHYTTEDEKENVFQKINNNSVIIPNGIDLRLYNNPPIKGTFKNTYQILKDKKYILFLGRVHKQKGINFLIEAFKLISNEYNDLYLVIAGPDNVGYKKELEGLLTKNHVYEKILFTGILSGREKLAAYIDAKIFVLPSYFENFGMAVIEAMACKTPVLISSKVGIHKELSDNNAGIVVDLNTENLFNQIKVLLKDSELSNEIAENGQKLVEKRYDINQIASQTVECYQELIASS